MKKIILATVIAASTAPAFAADLPRRQPVPDSIAYAGAPVGLWTGFYLGGHIGAGFSNQFDNSAGYGLSGSTNFLLGVQGGYDYQFANRFVLGLAADLTYSPMSRIYDAPGLSPDVRARTEWQGSVRTRLGYTIQDNMLLYGTVGVAMGGVQATQFSVPNVTESKFLAGWTAGVGGEYMFTRNIAALVEYRYTDIGRANFSGLTGSPAIGFEGHSVRTGVNYRF